MNNWLPQLDGLTPGVRVRLPDGSEGVVESVDPQFDDAVTVRKDSGGLTSRELTQLAPVNDFWTSNLIDADD